MSAFCCLLTNSLMNISCTHSGKNTGNTMTGAEQATYLTCVGEGTLISGNGWYEKDSPIMLFYLCIFHKRHYCTPESGQPVPTFCSTLVHTTATMLLFSICIHNTIRLLHLQHICECLYLQHTSTFASTTLMNTCIHSTLFNTCT